MKRFLIRAVIIIGIMATAIWFSLFKNNFNKENPKKITKMAEYKTKEKIEKPKNEQTKKAIAEALEIYKEKPVYSQSKRMLDGYVDCSSYVWRCWSKAGISFGQEDYAPTAAEIARWCRENNRLLSMKTVNGHSEKLESGDLIFYTKRKGNNGRFKNIAHVGIYIGNGKMLHADGASPSYQDPWYRKTAAVARPAGIAERER